MAFSYPEFAFYLVIPRFVYIPLSLCLSRIRKSQHADATYSMYKDYFPTTYPCNARQYRLSYVIVINVFTTYLPIMFVCDSSRKTHRNFRSYYVHIICVVRV